MPRPHRCLCRGTRGGQEPPGAWQKAGLSSWRSTTPLSEEKQLVHMSCDSFSALLTLPLPRAIHTSPSLSLGSGGPSGGCCERKGDFNSGILWPARSACKGRQKSKANQHKCFSHSSSLEKELISLKVPLNLRILKYLFPKALQGQL